ncbi:MAG: hypothetical protein RQ748_09410 [Elusimicrobiales bacterium]|nr:hypothetical protein [Elusimicrobiales bacterium]
MVPDLPKKRLQRLPYVTLLLIAAILAVLYAARRLPAPYPARVPAAAPVPVRPAVPAGTDASMPALPPQVEDKPGREELLRRAMTKYSDRPVVAEFLADLEKEPEAAGVLAGATGKDPGAVLSALKSEPGAYRLAAKYMARPDFIKLMMEVRRDPELAPLFNSGDSIRN